MNKAVLVALANRNYLEYAKQLFATVYWNSGWNGDYLLLAYDTPESDLAWFRNRGIKIRHCAPQECGSDKKGDKITATKCHLFSTFFRQWEHVVYLDVDIVTRGPLDGLVGLRGFAACKSLGQTLRDNLISASAIPSEVLLELQRNFDLDMPAFNSGVMAFPTSIIAEDTYAQLLDAFAKYVRYGSFGGDQLPFNLYFYRKWLPLAPIYNEITPLSVMFDPRKLGGIVLHCVCFGNGPWDQRSALHEEWLDNLRKADGIDLINIPLVAALSQPEIARRNRRVTRTYVTGGTGFGGFLRLMGRTASLALTKPGRVAQKIRSLMN